MPWVWILQVEHKGQADEDENEDFGAEAYELDGDTWYIFALRWHVIPGIVGFDDCACYQAYKTRLPHDLGNEVAKQSTCYYVERLLNCALGYES